MSHSGLPGSSNRRVIDRHRFCRSRPVEYLVKPSFQSRRAAIHDISPGGVGLMLNRAHQLETVLAILIQSRTADQTWIELARVCHVTQFEDGNWLLGCRFSRGLGTLEVSSLVDDEIFESADDEVITFSDSELYALILDPDVPRS